MFKYRHSIALHLLVVIFGFYFIVTLLVTTIQLYKEYENTKKTFYQEIQLLPATFSQGISDSVWTYNEELLESILKGVYNIPIVVGVEVKSVDHKMNYKIGAVLDDQARPVFYDSQGKLSKPTETGLGSSSLFGHTFPITYNGPAFKEPQYLGQVTLYSNERLVFERVKYGFFLILINSVVKTFALWLIIFYFIKRYLGKPLNEFTDKIKNQDINEPKPITLELPWSDKNEIQILKGSYNQMIEELNTKQQALVTLNAELDQMVKVRTHQLEKAKDEAEVLASTDMLTNLKTRRAFFEIGNHLFNEATRTGDHLSMIMMDIDHFKTINDTYGHSAGDKVLATFAQTISSLVRTSDLTGRIGGEEFALILARTDEQGAKQLAEKIRQAFMAIQVEYEGQIITSSASFGVIEADTKAFTLDEALALSDQALYEAKHRGRNQVVCYSELNSVS
ncbi:diguanylate cyclase [Thiomicrorhabdus sp.]|uniref:GGDEF domain-containing protein n=1 Tax=Thiomicrorhabdus sp. TaxID=2039724 RepID=UPI002AA71B78|nr:diguanylate cyclase [Thiomicrorhabdus sp.]